MQLFSPPKMPAYTPPAPPPAPVVPEIPPVATESKTSKLKDRQGDKANLMTGGSGLAAIKQGNLLKKQLGNKLGLAG